MNICQRAVAAVASDMRSQSCAALVPLRIACTVTPERAERMRWAISRRLRGEILRRERNAKWLQEAA